MWYENQTVYQIYTINQCKGVFINDFIDQHNVIELEKSISHLVDMKIDSVYFTPIFLSMTHGYDTIDYYKIDNRIGTNDEFKELINTFHQNGIKVIIDGVFNHVGRAFFAFKDLQQNGRSSKYINWFSGINFDRNSPKDDGFDYDTWAGHYELVKLNLKNAEVKSYLFDAVKYWINYFDIDGIRLDAANVLDAQFMEEIRVITDHLKSDFWLMGEIVSGDYKKIANEKMLHSATNYELFKALYSSHNDKNLFELAHCLDREFGAENGLYRHLYLYNFVDNHDQSRINTLLHRSEYLYTIHILLFTVKGVPSIYYGSEFGIKGVNGVENDNLVRPYIDYNNIIPVEKDLLHIIKKLIKIRKDNECLVYGDYKKLFISHKLLFAFLRTYKNTKIVVIINIDSVSKNVSYNDLSIDGEYYDILNDEHISGEEILVYSNFGRILIKK